MAVQSSPGATPQRRGRVPVVSAALVGVALVATASVAASAWSAAFVGPSSLRGGVQTTRGVRAELVARGAGFEELDAPKKAAKVSLSQDQLQKDHGDKWEDVDRILKGKKAVSPEAIMRARFTALKFKDVNFLAATEEDENRQTRKERAEGWAITLGLKFQEKGFFDDIPFFGGGNDEEEDSYSLRDPVSFEVVSADGDTVDFKIFCRDGKVLHEKSVFKEDRKWGYIYSGESEFFSWE